MATDLTNAVTITYAGITFPVMTASTVSAVPVYDAAGRTVVYVIYSLSVKSTLTVPFAPGNDVTDTLEIYRTALTKPGGQLVFNNCGFDLNINTSNADVRWGPRPKMLSWKPSGLQQAADFTWQVEVAIMECDPSTNTGIPLGTYRPPMEFNYRISYAIDTSGYTRRTYAGHVVIPQTRKSITDRTVGFSADREREDICPLVPAGFRRESQSFDLSEDKCRLNFSITDVEMGKSNYFPPGVVLARASHDLSTEPLTLVRWRGSIQAEYELAPNVLQGEAFGHFQTLVKDRLSEAAARRAAGGRAARTAAIPRSLTVREPEIYGKRMAAFTFGYQLTIDPADIAEGLAITGLFRGVPGSDWKAWHESMQAANVNRPRGMAQMYYKASDDRIIDICVVSYPLQKGNPIPSENAQFVDPAGPGNNAQFVDPVPQERGGLRGGIVKPYAGEGDLTPSTSWLDYQNEILLEQEDDVAECKLLPTTSIKQQRDRQGNVGDAAGGYTIPYTDTPQSVIQLRAKPVIAVVLQGRALRAGYDIAPPELASVGGVVPVLAMRAGVEYWSTSVVSNLGVPVVAAAWRFRWLLPQVPSTRIGSPGNPMWGEIASTAPVVQQQEFAQLR